MREEKAQEISGEKEKQFNSLLPATCCQRAAATLSYALSVLSFSL